jgi:integrase
MTLNEKSIAAIRRRAQDTAKLIETPHHAERGLRLLAYPTGRLVWSLRTTRRGSAKVLRLVLGDFPAMGVLDAQKAALAAKTETRAGIDPNEKRKAGIAASDGAITLSQLLEEWFTSPKAKARSRIEYRRSIGVTFRKLMDQPMTKINYLAVQRLAYDHAKTAPTGASHAVAYFKSIMKYAKALGHITIEQYVQLKLVEKPAAYKERQRILSPEELAAVIGVCRSPRDHDLSEAYGDLILFIMLTACRLREASNMPWRELTLEDAEPRWVLPAARSKNGKPHITPLSHQAAALLVRRRRDVLELDGVIDLDAPVFSNEEGRFWRHNWRRRLEQIERASDTSGWTHHDLRRTSRTMMSELRVPGAVADLVLNHTPPKLDRTYDVYQFLPERAAALQSLADRLDVIAHGGAQVVRMGRTSGA